MDRNKHCAHCTDLEGQLRALMDELAVTREQVRLANLKVSEGVREHVPAA